MQSELLENISSVFECILPCLMSQVSWCFSVCLCGSKAMTSEEEGPAAMGAEPHTDLCASPAWDGLVEEEAEPAEQEEAGVVDQAEQVQEVADDVSSELSALVVPYPELAHIVFFCLKQTTCPRNWCIRMVSSPYP
ncbi:voltage-dependent T-type calcium channel subunit alpha-1I-like protein [Labeo rohita]|uniref:Voltage-dependent T-type calcium channel subunit alpha-1I-like protein n=1 Tax=Labeo rohita TaxID=84645 RepID=A0A498NKU1_LABRO|nr:voltage-dependent T-type calcium channel subunit alpha-1I-like protein [Labeo rohita]